ncbi:MAG: PEGA domain-containing protein [Akkermansia sp.]|nr:PEGA domain-containing protein [Akkermansia sp.]
MKTKIKHIATVTSLFILSSCCSLINSRKQDIEVKCNVQNAKVIVDGVEKGVTPTKLNLKRSNKIHKLAIMAPGYEPLYIELKPGISGWFFGNLLLGGAIGMIVDGCTDYCWSYPDVDAKLLPPASKH